MSICLKHVSITPIIIAFMIRLCEEPKKKWVEWGVNLGSSLQKYIEHKYNIICEKSVKKDNQKVRRSVFESMTLLIESKKAI